MPGRPFWVWPEPFFAEAPSRWDLWIVDLNGTTAVVLAEVTTGTAQMDQIEQIVDSIQIGP